MGIRDTSIPTVVEFQKNDSGQIIFGTVTGTPPTTALKFAKGCILLESVFGRMYLNTGTFASPVWTKVSGTGIVEQNTDGTTAVSVWADGAPANLTITGVYLISLDTTAGNITVENPASTVVCTIAKGTTAGVMVGATSLANTTVAVGTDVVVDSSSAGNAKVFITYELTN